VERVFGMSLRNEGDILDKIYKVLFLYKKNYNFIVVSIQCKIKKISICKFYSIRWLKTFASSSKYVAMKL